jgi:hypothetical protein
MKKIIWIMVFISMLLFTGVFNDETNILQKIILIILSLIFVTAPIYLKNNPQRGIDLSDKRNAIILALAGFLSLSSISYSISSGILSVQLVLSLFFSMLILYAAVAVVKVHRGNSTSDNI